MVQFSHWKLAEITGEAKRSTRSFELLVGMCALSECVCVGGGGGGGNTG